MKNKKISIIYTFMLSFLFICTFHTSVSAADPKLVTVILYLLKEKKKK